MATLISQVVTVANQTTVTFSSIPQNYLNLYITVEGASSQTSTTTSDTLIMQFNGDTATHYFSNYFLLWPSGSTTSGAGTGGAVFIYAGILSSNGATATNNSYNAITIYNYTQTSYPIECSVIGNGTQNNVGAMTYFGGGRWLPTALAAITSVSLIVGSSDKFTTGSIVSLYGLPN